MIDEAEIQAALDYLLESAPLIAQARADMVLAEELRKVVKAGVMKEHAELAVGAQEREAYADPRYRAQLDKIHAAVLMFEKERAKREAAMARIDAWRTEAANRRGADRIG